MIKWLVISMCLLVGIVSLNAQPNNSQGTSDPKATAVLDKVSAKYKGYTAFKGKYSLRIESAEGDMDEEQTGTFYIRGKSYKLENADQEIICNNETIWFYLKEVNEVQVNIYEPDESTLTPDQIFTIYDKKFLSVHSGTVTKGSTKLHLIELTPLDKSKPYFKIKLFVNVATNEIVICKIYDKNGNRYIYSMKELKANPTLPPNFFTFNVKEHPGVEVVDLR